MCIRDRFFIPSHIIKIWLDLPRFKWTCPINYSRSFFQVYCWVFGGCSHIWNLSCKLCSKFTIIFTYIKLLNFINCVSSVHLQCSRNFLVIKYLFLWIQAIVGVIFLHRSWGLNFGFDLQLLGPVVQKKIDAIPRLKVNEGVYFSTPRCCWMLIFGQTLH